RVGDAVNRRIMSLIPVLRYSKVAAPQPAGLDSSERLTVDAAAQIPRSPRGGRLHRGVTYRPRRPPAAQMPRGPGGARLHRGVPSRPGLRLDVHPPAAGGRHPLVVYLPGGGFVRASRSLARREPPYVASAGYVAA